MMKSNLKRQRLFIERALRSRQHMANNGLVVDGALFGDYLKAKVRGLVATQPVAKQIKFFVVQG